MVVAVRTAALEPVMGGGPGWLYGPCAAHGVYCRPVLLGVACVKRWFRMNDMACHMP